MGKFNLSLKSSVKKTFKFSFILNLFLSMDEQPQQSYPFGVVSGEVKTGFTLEEALKMGDSTESKVSKHRMDAHMGVYSVNVSAVGKQYLTKDRERSVSGYPFIKERNLEFLL